MPDFPESMKVSNLLKTHPLYDKQKLDRLNAYYCGGDEFDKIKEQELRSKPIESATDGKAALIGAAIRKARLQCGDYTSYLGDTIKNLVAVLCMMPLMITDKKERPYWSQLQFCADGQYATGTSITRAVSTDDFLFNRCFYLVKFPKPKAPVGATLDVQLAAGDLDAEVTNLHALIVNDWKTDEDDEKAGLLYARTLEVKDIQSTPFGPYDQSQYTWTYYGKNSVKTYRAIKQKDMTEKDWEEMTAKGDDEEPHSLGVCPVFKVERKLKAAVGETILPTAHRLYNQEADTEYYRMTTITGGIFVFADDPNKWLNMQLTPFGAVIGGKDDSVDRDKCDAAALEALEKGCAASRGQMGGLIHQMAMQTASQSASGQNTSRATGKAIEKHSDPLNAFELGFKEGHIGTWRRMVSAICNIRDEDDEDITVGGLIEIEEDDSELEVVTSDKMQAEAAFEALPYVPKEAKIARGKTLGLQANPDADEKTVKAIEEATIEEPAQNAAQATQSTTVGGEQSQAISAGQPSVASGGTASNLTVSNSIQPSVSGIKNGASQAVKTAASGTVRAGLANQGDIRINAPVKQIDPSEILSQHGVDEGFAQELMADMKANGYDKNYPVLSVETLYGHILLDGTHRGNVAKALKMKTIPSYVVPYDEYSQLLAAKCGGVRPKKLSDLDQYIYVKKNGKSVPYTQVRQPNDHNNAGSPVTTAAVSQ